MSKLQEQGWKNWKSYPLLIAGDTEMALTKYCADKQLTRGKALNQLIRHALAQGGFLASAETCRHDFNGHYGDNGVKFFECEKCKEVYVPA